MKSKTQQEQVLYYLYNYKNFTLKDVINDTMLYKFNARLSELEHKFGTLAKRKKVSFINRFGNSGTYCVYSAIDKNQILKIFNKLQNGK